MQSQSGPLASVPFVAFSHLRAHPVWFPTVPHLPSPSPPPSRSPSTRYCRCGPPFDCLGHHRAACSVAGILGKRGFPLEIAAARVCREAGTRIQTNVMVREMDLVPNVDNRRSSPTDFRCVVEPSSPQVSALRRDGTSRPQNSIDGIHWLQDGTRQELLEEMAEPASSSSLRRWEDVGPKKLSSFWCPCHRQGKVCSSAASAERACCLAPSLERFVGMHSSP